MNQEQSNSHVSSAPASRAAGPAVCEASPGLGCDLMRENHPHPGRRRCVARRPGPLGLRLLPLPLPVSLVGAVSVAGVSEMCPSRAPALCEAWSHTEVPLCADGGLFFLYHSV